MRVFLSFIKFIHDGCLRYLVAMVCIAYVISSDIDPWIFLCPYQVFHRDLAISEAEYRVLCGFDLIYKVMIPLSNVDKMSLSDKEDS